MRHSPIAVAAVAAFALLAPMKLAWAGPLGGFSADETRYLIGRDTICTPIAITGPAVSAVPACERADDDAVSAMKFRRGTLQLGRDAAFEASARGRRLSLRSIDATTGGVELVMWTSADPIERVVSVHASRNARIVAVEYEVRFGGRVRVDVVGFALADTARHDAPASEPRVPPAPESSPATAQPQPAASPVPALPEHAARALARARRLAARKRHAQAARAYEQVLAADPDHAEARFGLARTLAARKRAQAAIRELEKLAASNRPDAIVWRVEARFDRAFAKLRGDAAFRRATGLERAPGAAGPGLYERVVGFTTTWEQSEVTCQSAEVRLDLERLERTFKLRITSRCGGYKDVTRLKGTWRLYGHSDMRLSLPNKRAKDEAFQCVVKTCGAEDCITCPIDTDLEFTLRPVRR